MRKALAKLLVVFVIYLMTGVHQKPLFMLAHGAMSATPLSAADWLSVVWHGLPMDCAVAGYLTSIPFIFIILAVAGVPTRCIRIAEYVWYGLSAAVIALIFLLDMGLYPSWGFKLDVSPIFYFTTSPAAAMASVTVGQGIAALISFLILSLGIFFVFRKLVVPIEVAPTSLSPKDLAGASALMLLAGGLLFVAIRGGVTVSTMNLSRSYFSSNNFLNHAAVNPAFSLMYSATHQQNFGRQFRYMPDEQAAGLFAGLHKVQTAPRAEADSLLIAGRPDIYIVILESFSAELFPHLGGEPIAIGLDSIARCGITFTNFYANGFRTDRGLPAILSGFPGAPTASVMKYVDKASALPGIAASLADNGWKTTYYYGGDINFTNLSAYLINTGFQTIVCDKDFPLAERTSKWGAHDHNVFNRCLADATSTLPTAPPQLRVIQTSSSHEPFSVPFSRLADERANAFAYTDSCATAFIDSLASAPRPWLAILVADHYGAYPRRIDDPVRRHQIPLILTGTALRKDHMAVPTPGSQADIAATLLSMLGIRADGFMFSTDMLDPVAPHAAFFSEPGIMGLVTQKGRLIYNIDSDSYVNTYAEPAAADSLMLPATKAYLQTIYNYLHTLSSSNNGNPSKP